MVPSDSVCHSCPTSRVQTQPPTCPVPHVPFTCQRVEALARSGGEAWLGCWAKLASSLRFSAYPTKLTNPAHRALLQSRQSGSHTQTTSHSTQRFCRARPVCVDACTCRRRERRHFPHTSKRANSPAPGLAHKPARFWHYPERAPIPQVTGSDLRGGPPPSTDAVCKFGLSPVHLTNWP